MIRAELARRRTSAGIHDILEESRARCKSLLGFIREAWHVLLPDTDYIHGWHLEELCTHLQAITRGEFLARGLDNRFIANVPPGTMKSLTVMVFWQAWEWGPEAMPFIQDIATSYRADYCVRDSLRFRKLIVSDWYQARWPIILTKENETHIENERGGFRDAVPFSSLLGGRADRLLIDDPHSIDGAESDLDRERAVRNFRETGVLRLNDPQKSAIVIIMQRLHERDLTGVIISLGLAYIHLMLPMRFEKERGCRTPFGGDRRTKDGELLFPERFPPSVLDRDEKAMTAYAIASQNQQRPAPRGGLMFKRFWFPIKPAAPGSCRWVRAWDLAATEGGGAFTSGVLLGYEPRQRHYYIGHVVREQVANPEGLIKRWADVDGTSVEITLPQDPGASGKVQARSLVAALAGYNVVATPESGDKIMRARPVAAQAEVGNFTIISDQDGGDKWNDTLLRELECVPAGTSVLVLGGAKAIEDIQPGDSVMTRVGWRRVLRSGCTSKRAQLCEITFSHGLQLRCTLNHPIFRVNFGFTSASSLTVGDILLRFTEGSNSGRDHGGTTLGHSAPLMGKGKCFTAISMSKKLGQSLSAMISTIKTAISTIIHQEILLHYPAPNTCAYPGHCGITNALYAEQISERRGLGSAAQSDAEIKCDHKSFQQRTRTVMRVDANLRDAEDQDFVALNVLSKSGAAINQSNANAVEIDLFQKQSISGFAVNPAQIERICLLSGEHEVFNLEVEEAHEYVANGILVHNCFPTGAYKDQVDALSRAFAHFVMRPGASMVGPIVIAAPLVIYGTPDGG